MKSFIISLVIFSLLLILVTANSFYVHGVCDEMLTDYRSLLINDIDRANRLCETWKKHRAIFSISIYDSHLEKITELTENIKSAATIGNGAEFKKNINLLTEILEELKKNEEISFQGII